MRRGQYRALQRACLFVFCVSCFFLALRHARADGDFNGAGPERREWFRQQRNLIGEVCCDHTEAFTVDDYQWVDGRWRVTVRGVTVEVPPERVDPKVNPYGSAIVWIYPRGAEITAATTRCFLRGMEG